jgi:anti-sigma regulatory factor (Ser/Thr protein kinase)
VREVRRFVRDTLVAAGVSPAAVEDAVLLTSEVLGNAVVHAATAAELRLAIHGQRVRVEVSDGSADFPEVRVFDFVSASGRGLRILAAIAADWGVEPLPGKGKRVWFELAS